MQDVIDTGTGVAPTLMGRRVRPACGTTDARRGRRWRLLVGACGFAAALGLLASRTAPPVTPSAAEEGHLVVSLGPDGRDLRFAGDFLDGAAAEVKALLDANPRIERIHLTSEGGYVDEGRAVGALIAERGLTTYVPDYCVSACTLVFVRGRERIVQAGARLGFHAPFEPDEAGRELQVDGSEEERDYVAAGVSPDFARAAITTPSAEMWFPDADRLKAAGVVTAVVDAGSFPDSTLDGEATLAGARAAAVRNMPLLAAFGRAAAVDDIAAWYLAGYRRGLSESAAAEGLDTLTAALVRGTLAGTDGATLRSASDLVARALDVSGDDPSVCGAIAGSLEGANLVAAQAVLDRAGQAPGAVRGLVDRILADRPILARIPPDTSPGPTLDASCDTLRTRYAAALRIPYDPGTLRALLIGGGGPPRLEAAARPRTR